jgi:hypothetical protein
MKPNSAIAPLLLIPILLISSAQGEEPATSVYTRPALSFEVRDGQPRYEIDDPNAVFRPILLPGELKFDRLTEGQEIPLGTVIVVPSLDEEGFLTLEFRRSDMKKSFIQTVFFDDDSLSPHSMENNSYRTDIFGNRISLSGLHPFTERGIDHELTDERFILNIHTRVSFHLRDFAESYLEFIRPEYMNFVGDYVTAKVTEVIGDVQYSVDPMFVELKLSNFYASVYEIVDRSTWIETVRQRPDGTYEIVLEGQDVFRERYPPKVTEGP